MQAGFSRREICTAVGGKPRWTSTEDLAVGQTATLEVYGQIRTAPGAQLVNEVRVSADGQKFLAGAVTTVPVVAPWISKPPKETSARFSRAI